MITNRFEVLTSIEIENEEEDFRVFITGEACEEHDFDTSYHYRNVRILKITTEDGDPVNLQFDDIERAKNALWQEGFNC
jgi:hypothetical protein